MNESVKTWQRTIGVGADGEFGPRTLAASLALVNKTPATDRWPHQADVVAHFGPAGGVDCTAGQVRLPMPFVLAWDTSTKIERFACHKKVAGAFNAVFANAFNHYGADRFVNLGLNVFGGCYNFRAMRGGTQLSMHSWGIAVDLDPTNNQLRWGRDKATFARPDYDAWWEIVEAEGLVSLGRARNYDWMHMQAARL